MSLANNPKGEPSKYRSPHPQTTNKGNTVFQVTITTNENVYSKTFDNIQAAKDWRAGMTIACRRALVGHTLEAVSI